MATINPKHKKQRYYYQCEHNQICFNFNTKDFHWVIPFLFYCFPSYLHLRHPKSEVQSAVTLNTERPRAPWSSRKI